jgi:hypothetical protein
MKPASSRSALLWGALLGTGFAVGAGCMNGAMHNYKARIGGGGRFALVIESDRTLVEGTHFLVDTATGDVWRLTSPDGRSGAWARLSAPPEDVKPLGEPENAEADDDA